MEPLASRMRPNSFSDVVGQDHLVAKNGVLQKMILQKKWISFILYGNPGTGKTTIARLFAKESGVDHYFFNASTDNKAKLKDIIDTTIYHDILIIIDEIHRMKTDIQDYLLPFMENGKVTVIGITTLNPYQSINMAIRSRCHLYKINDLDDDAIITVIKRALKMLDVNVTIGIDSLKLIARFSNHEIRSALNILESASLILNDGDEIIPNTIRQISGKMMHDLDNHEDNFFELLSALQKSIRGSDVDASLFYLARLIVLGDLEAISRRLMVIVYEDVGLANPSLQNRVFIALEVAKRVGFPEARIPLSVITVEMALSPKSNTAYIGLENAIFDFEENDTGVVPPHADNKKIKRDPSIYHYPHDDIGSVNDQTYLPEKIKDKCYFFPKDESPFEKAIANRLEFLDKIKNKKRAKNNKDI